jgi:hypothetical protein
LILSAVIVALLPSHAGAAPLSNGVVTITTGSGKTEVNPLSNGQNVNVSVAANPTLDLQSREAAGFPSGAVAIKVLECADSGGLVSNLPKSPTGCEPTTIQSTAFIGTNGSLVLKGYTVYALPDEAVLSSSNGTTCDDSVHQCVIGIFTNQNDFTKPHIFSGPFQITAAAAAGASTSGSAPQTPAGSTSGTGAGSVSPGVTIAPDTLAYTGAPTFWPWLLGSGFVLLIVGTVLRLYRRRTL